MSGSRALSFSSSREQVDSQFGIFHVLRLSRAKAFQFWVYNDIIVRLPVQIKIWQAAVILFVYGFFLLSYSFLSEPTLQTLIHPVMWLSGITKKAQVNTIL
jgi:hypothetical protein